MTENRSAYQMTKRAIDITLATIIILPSLPVMMSIWLYIRCNSSGPVLFRQIRIKKNRRQQDDRRGQSPDKETTENCRRKESRRGLGYYGTPFTFYKFATMYPDARRRFPELYTYDYTKENLERLVFKIKDDPRIPPWAKWLRKSSLDELPNFINVLKGDMTLVGPRPDIPEMVRYYNEEQYQIKLSVKPGVTGFAQIYGRGNLSFQDTLAYDLEYVRKASLALDMKILMLTFFKIFKGRNGGAF